MLRISIALACGVCLLASEPGLAQEAGEPDQASVREAVVHEIHRATSEIFIDGALDEPAWLDATEISIDYEWFPGDNIEAAGQDGGLGDLRRPERLRRIPGVGLRAGPDPCSPDG